MSRNPINLPKVTITAHARLRARQLGLQGNLENRISWGLYNRLRRGAVPDDSGEVAVHVGLRGDRYAVCIPVQVGWRAVTIYTPGVYFNDEGAIPKERGGQHGCNLG